MMFKNIAPDKIKAALTGMLNKGSISTEEYSDIIGRMAAGCTDFSEEWCDE